MHFLLNIIYLSRHVIAVCCTLIGIWLINEVTVMLYLLPDNPGIFLVIKTLWLSGDLFLRFILMINFFVKPIFIYLSIYYLLSLIKR
ncbi:MULTISPECIES: hypothetical protein [unclassified Legionella]|uniref:hypothetical protein n=1 Tax=unclassified Legionella TaxID=2622702 RepID=UPI001054163A|nr:MULTISPECIES: hypothetical protein [unclassified Legionella]MDI9817581.1 hypothetical protein [Legionella sp. PL877]